MAKRKKSFKVTKDGPFPFELTQKYPQAIYSVEHVEIKIIALNGPTLALITAVGTTVTAGWHNPRLQPYIYIQPPPNGIWDFVFVAEPPAGESAEILTPITTSYTFPIKITQFSGVRVHSATNTKTATLRGKPLKINTKTKLGVKAPPRR